MSSLNAPATSSVSFSGTTIAVVNSIKQSIATSASPASYSGAALDGGSANPGPAVFGTATSGCGRRVTATLASHASSYVLNSTITITGTDYLGNAQTDVLTIPGTGGGVTLTSTKFFRSVSQLDIQAQADGLGSFQFGMSDALVSARELRVGTAGDLHVQYSDGHTDTITKVQAGEHVPGMIQIIFGDNKTTAQDITAYR